ncbi:MAG: class I SAM-dependent methyltransferase [Bacteroidota bacterium]
MNIHLAQQWFRHQWQAKTAHGVHSPFVFQLVEDVFPYRKSEAGRQVEAIRKKLAGSEQEVRFADLGAGSLNRGGGEVKTTLGQLARRAARQRRSGELLYRLCRHLQPQRMLEFGTNLGISAMYQRLAVPESQFVSLEGAKTLAEIARQNLAETGQNLDIIHVDFDHWLTTDALQNMRPDYVFLDGNHQYKPTRDYVEQFLTHMPKDSLLILDDIHWSSGMSRAWAEICKDERISVSIDLLYLGLCFVRKHQAKEHFILRM